MIKIYHSCICVFYAVIIESMWKKCFANTALNLNKTSLLISLLYINILSMGGCTLYKKLIINLNDCMIYRCYLHVYNSVLLNLLQFISI